MVACAFLSCSVSPDIRVYCVFVIAYLVLSCRNVKSSAAEIEGSTIFRG